MCGTADRRAMKARTRIGEDPGVPHYREVRQRLEAIGLQHFQDGVGPVFAREFGYDAEGNTTLSA